MVEHSLFHWQTHRRSAEEAGKVIAFFGHFLNDLYSCSAGTDDSNFLAPGTHVLGPEAGVVDNTPEFLQTGKVGIVSSMKQTSAHDEILTADYLVGFASCFILALPIAILHLRADFPLALIFDPPAVVDMGVEEDIFTKTEYIVEVSEVFANLLVTRKALSESPVIVGFWDVELVVWPL